MVILGIATGKRFQNIGRSKYWGWSVLVPPLFIFFLAYGLYAPEGFAHSGKLDLAGRIIAICLGVIVIASIGIWVFFANL